MLKNMLHHFEEWTSLWLFVSIDDCDRVNEEHGIFICWYLCFDSPTTFLFTFKSIRN